MLGFMAVTGFFGLHNLQGLDIALFPHDEIYRFIPTHLTVQITSRRRFLPYCLLKLQIESAEFQIPILGRRETIRSKLLVSFPDRGPGRISRIIVTSTFPVNFFVRSNTVSVSADYLVFPEPVQLPSGQVSGGTEKRGDALSPLKGGGGEVEAITTYTGQEPLKLVHWRLSARHDELLVKELGAEAGAPVMINPDELPGKLEERLSHAVFLVNSLMAAGKAVGLKLSDRELPPGISRQHRLKILGELAHHVAD